MRYCHQCHRITTGEPLFCNFCGRSYNVKLCPSRHPNPRNAEICSQCGSRELSTPQPRVPLSLKLMHLLLWMLGGAVCLFATLSVLAAGLHAFASSGRLQAQFLCLAVLGGAIAWLYMQLPSGLRRLLSKLFGRGKHRGKSQHGEDKHGH